MALTPGTRLGVYEITAPIGEGGKGQVFRATDTKLKRQVAFKILPPSLAADQDRLARFQREAEVLASPNHTHIAQLESTLVERWFEQGLDRLLEFRQFLLDDTPHDFEVHAKIVVNDFVAHSCDLLPRNMRLATSCVVGKILDRLANHLELTERGVLPHALGKEHITASTSVGRNVVQRVADVFELDAIVLHNGAASARIRWRRDRD